MVNDVPFFSIIVPVYNVAPFLKECLESILGQSFVDFELILINDGSTDDSVKIIQQFSDGRIKYFYQENKGLSAVRNKGLTIANGKYVWFVDGDDKIAENALSNIYNALELKQTDLLVINASIINDKSEIIKDYFKLPLNFELINTTNQFLNRYHYYPTTEWLHIYKVAFLRGFAESVYKKYIIFEDDYFHLQIYNNSYNISWAGLDTESLYYYRKRANSITSKNIGFKELFSKIAILSLATTLFEQKKIPKQTYANRVFYDFKYLIKHSKSATLTNQQKKLLITYIKNISIYIIPLVINTQALQDPILLIKILFLKLQKSISNKIFFFS